MVCRFIHINLKIITGESKTGKSAIIHIVDYCLGSTGIRLEMRALTQAVGGLRHNARQTGAAWSLMRLFVSGARKDRLAIGEHHAHPPRGFASWFPPASARTSARSPTSRNFKDALVQGPRCLCWWKHVHRGQRRLRDDKCLYSINPKSRPEMLVASGDNH
jgi:hypothetical protein